MQTWDFIFDGIKGKAQAWDGGCYIFWGGMGFHIIHANDDLRDAILAARPVGA